jgi:hypothetical protein
VTAVTEVLFDNASFFGQRTGSEAGRPRKAGNCLGGIIGLGIAIRVRRWMRRWRLQKAIRCCLMVDPRVKLAFMQLVLARSVSVEQAARRYGRHERAIRRWCLLAREAAMKWDHRHNLRLRPAKPALGRGKLQIRVRRAFLTADAPAIPASKIYDWCYARRRLLLGKPLTTRHRYSVWQILVAIADPVARDASIGRPILWRLRQNAGAKLPLCFPAKIRNEVREQYRGLFRIVSLSMYQQLSERGLQHGSGTAALVELPIVFDEQMFGRK